MFTILESVIHNVIREEKSVRQRYEISRNHSSDQTYLISLKNHQIWWPGTCYLMLIEHYKIENVVMERLIKATIICNKLKETKMKSHCLVPVK